MSFFLAHPNQAWRRFADAFMSACLVAIMASLAIAHAVAVPLWAQATKPLTPAPSSAAGVVDHSAFDALLRQHVVDGRVNYGAFRGNAAFSRYLAGLKDVKVALLEPDERLAFWLNVYNAYTIDLIARNDERRSIRNLYLTLGFLRLKGPWSQPLVQAAGRTLTLDDVEHHMIRKEFHDPRVHFALSYAAKGGALLRSEAYTGQQLQAQLEDQTRRFLRQSPTQNRLDLKARTLYFSPIFFNYREDFGGTLQAVFKFVAGYYPDDPEHAFLLGRSVRPQQTRFDWSLNSQP